MSGLYAALVGAAVGAIISGIASFLVARWQMNKTTGQQVKQAYEMAERARDIHRKETLYMDLLATLSKILDSNAAERLKEDPNAVMNAIGDYYIADEAVWLSRGSYAVTEYRASIMEYETAVRAYAKNELSKEDFEKRRLKTGEEVASALRRDPMFTKLTEPT